MVTDWAKWKATTVRISATAIIVKGFAVIQAPSRSINCVLFHLVFGFY